MVTIYVLKLKQNKYYVGKTTNPTYRLDDHFSEGGSVWTQKYKPISIHELRPDRPDTDEQIVTQEYMKKYLNRSNLFHTRYRSILGQTTRQVVYAIMLGYKNIYVVGLDGMHYDGTIHSFEEQKKLPSWYMTSHGHAMQNRHFIIYWEYIYELAKKYGCSVYNLGEGRRYNISSNITRYHTPLPPHIKKKLEI